MTLSVMQQTTLFESLYYLNMAELKEICKQLHIPLKKGKLHMIEAIKQVVTTGAVSTIKEIPATSRAQKDIQYPLTSQTRILFGSYKNDLQTRIFFKELIGLHFHFTAFGIDWIKARWHAGNPPTYQEFAQMWQQEYERRRKQPERPKKEWAYINFLQNYTKQHPIASAHEARKAWKKARTEQVQRVQELLKNI